MKPGIRVTIADWSGEILTKSWSPDPAAGEESLRTLLALLEEVKLIGETFAEALRRENDLERAARAAGEIQ